MSGTSDSNSSNPEREAISRLVDLGRTGGQKDVFLAKRRWFRHKVGLSLDVTTDPSDPSLTWPVIMHNVSGGGIGFWSKRELCLHEAIQIRKYANDNSDAWIRAHVTHSTVGIQGYLIGAAFDDPFPPDTMSRDPDSALNTDTAPTGPEDTKVPAPTRAFLPGRSLRLKSASAAVVASCIGVVAGSVGFDFFLLDSWPVWARLATILLAVGLGALGGWTIVGGEIRFADGMMAAIRRMAKGDTNAPLPPEEPSKEFGELRRAFVKMGTAWRKREEDERVHREKLEELNQIKNNILSTVSHDLRTPLTSILLYARMLTDELNTLAEEDQRRFLDIISDECNRLSAIVDDLLEVQRLESDKIKWDMQPQDLSETIRSCAMVLQAMAASKAIDLGVDCPDSLPEVEADPEKISQVLNNLISNALKYTQRGGSVRISAETSGRDILIRVSDNGPGIPREKWDQIFDRFMQLSDPNTSEIAGVGLGLYIVKRIVERHGGSVWVDSEVGHGSEFTISLPVKADERKQNRESGITSTARRIVVCDADPELAAKISQTLRAENFDVRIVHSGCRLLAHLAEAQPDLAITDVLLPDMDAGELLEGINNLPTRSFRLIVHSYAGSDPHLRRQGVDIFLRRPSSQQELIQAVNVAMQKRYVVGMTVLLAGESDRFDQKAFNRVLSDGGHLPIATETTTAAKALIQDYPIDVVLAFAEELGDDWTELNDLRASGSDSMRLMVLCAKVGRKERQLAKAHGVTAVRFTPGDEEALLGVITASEQSLL